MRETAQNVPGNALKGTRGSSKSSRNGSNPYLGRILALERSSQAFERGGTIISEGVQVLQAVSEIFVRGGGGDENFGGPNIT